MSNTDKRKNYTSQVKVTTEGNVGDIHHVRQDNASVDDYAHQGTVVHHSQYETFNNSEEKHEVPQIAVTCGGTVCNVHHVGQGVEDAGDHAHRNSNATTKVNTNIHTKIN